MVNVDIFKSTIEEDLKKIAKCKLDILILQREIEKDDLYIKNNAEIKRLNNVIESRELSSKNQLKKFVCNELGIDFMDEGLGEETEEFKKLWCEGVANLDLEERKIKTSVGSVIYAVMPDKWEYDIPKLIRWARDDDERRIRYLKVIEEFRKDQLKKDYANGLIGHDDICDEGVNITPQEPKFNYKLNGGL